MSTKNHNLDDIKKKVSDLCQQLDEKESERQGLAQNVEAIRSRLESNGIPRKALQMARSYAKMDENQRRGFDIAYEIVREALGLPLQDDVEDFMARQQAQQKQDGDGDGGSGGKGRKKKQQEDTTIPAEESVH